jgi:hydroxymethylpyrimidine/phosphomethylpyrimidine kinase
MDMEKAVGQAKKFITGAIKNNFPVGQGNSPVNHLWRLQNLQHSSNQQFS